MYSDGMLGNKAIFAGLAPLTTAVYNFMRSDKQSAFKQEQMFPWIDQYWENPDYEPSPKEKVSDSLIAYMSQAKGFSKARLK